MKKNKVLILGTGHLAYRVKKLATQNGYTVVHSSVSRQFQKQGPVFDEIQELFKEVDLNEMAMVYLLDDRDDYNLGLAIALISANAHVPITVSLFNENIAPHLQATHPNLFILNPAKIAAPKFVWSLYEPVTRFLRYKPVKIHEELKSKNPDYLIRQLVLLFLGLILLATAFFHWFEKMPLLDSLYFVVATIGTVGYGDINLLNADPLSKVVDIVLIISSMFFVWVIFSLTMDQVIKVRSEYALGRKKYNYKDHVIVCGLGRLGFFIVEDLLKRGERVVVVESNEKSSNIAHFKKLGVGVYVGDARLPGILQDVGVAKARALISVVDDDYINLEVGLSARSFQPDLRLVLRIFDDAMVEDIKQHLDIHLAFSMSALADDTFFETIDKKMK